MATAQAKTKAPGKKAVGAKRVAQLFYRGDHQQLLDETIDSPSGGRSEGMGFASGATDPAALPYLIGALTFLGRQEEADVLFERHGRKLAREGECMARFFLGIALCRHSHYDRALDHLVRNLRLVRGNRKPSLLNVYAFQGIAFYRYFCGRYANALQAGRRAFQAAVAVEYLYGKFLAVDLMGHALLQTGEVSSGLQRLRESIRYSKLLGDGQIDHGVRISLACYQAAFGISPKTDVETLQKLSRKLSPQDTYSQGSLLLEIGRQLSLRGQHRASQESLNQACRLIYSSGNRRQGVLLNLRYAQNLYLVGEYHQALSLIRSTTRELDSRVDKALQLQIWGMELKLKRALGLAAENDPLEEKIRRLVRYTGMGVARRMLKREAGGPTYLRALGEDALGDLLDVSLSSETGDNLSDILASGYLSLLYRRLPIEPGESALYFDVEPDSLLIVDRGDLELVPRGVSQVLKGIARALENGECTKERLIQSIWGYRYDRLRHDPLIYQAVSRLRQLLGSRGRWLEATEQGYRLAGGVRVRFYRPLSAGRGELPPPEARLPEDDLIAVLNHRQLAILRKFRNREFFDVQTCKALFKVSQITATRDLSGLHRLSLVKRIGKGRATRYFTLGG